MCVCVSVVCERDKEKERDERDVKSSQPSQEGILKN